MKNVVMLIISIILGAITLVILMSVYGRVNRSAELQVLSSVVEKTVENMTVSKTYDIRNAEEYVADFTENLSVQFDTDSTITVDVMRADKEKGLLSVSVMQTFRHPNGKTGTVHCDRTVILNKTEEPVTPTYTVQFFTGDTYYKSYTVYEGDIISAPAGPEMSGAVFIGWKDENDYLADFSQPIEQDVTYYAMWS